MTEFEHRVLLHRLTLAVGIGVLLLALWLIGGCAMSSLSPEQAFHEGLAQARLAAIDPRIDVKRASRAAFRQWACCAAWGRGRSYRWLAELHDTFWDGSGLEVLGPSGWVRWEAERKETEDGCTQD